MKIDVVRFDSDFLIQSKPVFFKNKLKLWNYNYINGVIGNDTSKILNFLFIGFESEWLYPTCHKTNNEKQALDQQAVRGLNAMYQYPSYDYSGHFSVNVDASTAQSRKNHPAPALLDPALQLKIDQF